jgi:hypothetical protein
MKNLQDATERICELKGSLVALDALVAALINSLPVEARATLARSFETHAEVARTVLINTPTSEHTVAAFERDVRRTGALLDS